MHAGSIRERPRRSPQRFIAKIAFQDRARPLGIPIFYSIAKPGLTACERGRWKGGGAIGHPAMKDPKANTIAEDIAPRPGDVVMMRCDVVMANDITGPVAFRQMEKMGATTVFDPSKVVMVADHFVPAKDARSAELQKRLKEWSDAQGVTFYGQGRGGIEHTLLCEEGWVVPGSVIAGGDSHTCTYGALAAFGSGFGSTDIAACLVFGEFWQTVPATIQVEFTGEKGRFVAGKDLILAVIGEIGVGGATNCALEFVGECRERQQDLVRRRVEQRVQRYGYLAGAEVRAEVPADLADRVDDQLAHLLRDLSQLLVGTAREIGGAVDLLKKARPGALVV